MSFSHTLFQTSKNVVSEEKNSSSTISYYKGTYKETHWALHKPTLEEDKNFIATLKINGIFMGLKLNSTDARGYRAIVCLVTEDKSQMHTTFNREYTEIEEFALITALAILQRAYKKHGMIAQISIAGNNSQSVNADGSVQIGNEKEPSLLHGHVIGRGNPKTAYIGKVPLSGPPAGFEMNLRGDGNDEGNRSKEKWNPMDMEIVASCLGDTIFQLSKEFPGVDIISIRTRETYNQPRPS